MEETAVGLLPPILSDTLTFLSIILGIILLIAIAYVWSTQRQDREAVEKLSTELKTLSKKVKQLSETPSNKEVIPQESDKIQKVENSEIPNNKKDLPDKSIKRPWDDFLVDYNYIAASMAVPGQLRACENFVEKNDLQLLAYSGSMTFIKVASVEDSRFWAWNIPGSNQYAIVVNPMIPYDEELHSREGMKETFASNFDNGKYKKYIIELPAIFMFEDQSKWKLSNPGIMKLER